MTNSESLPAWKGQRGGWIPEDEYRRIQSLVPILCVDVLLGTEESVPRIGLILRDTYGGAQGWCLVGGAVLRNEPVAQAVQRHVAETLGERLELNVGSLRLAEVIEYFSAPGLGDFHDPRKHAVALTYSATCSGTPVPRGEAHAFQWFDPGKLDSVNFGFGQGEVVRRVLRQTLERMDRP